MDDVVKDPSPDAISITDCLKYESIDAESTKHFSSGTNGYAPKVRKPYIMTKQREPWTEEQHQKFVEALKLYGRAWRQIEEYVGTKTAIQIRSHAQKFFAKVTRDSGACREVSLNLGDIPPPRPKKKPRHPYPRKMANIDVRDMESMNSDGQKYSPTSAFSATSGSGNVEADMQKPCLSPISCATSHISSEVENASPLAMEKSSASVSNKLTMKLELFPEVAESTIDSSYNARQGTSIKLFGKTVFISDAGAESLEENCGTKDQLLHNVEWKVQFFTEKEPRRAFVPYKRCLSERDDNSSMNLLEDWESRTARVCS